MRLSACHHRFTRMLRGFSLVELSVVIAIMSVVAVLGLEGAASFVNRTSGSVTQERLAVADDAVARFFKIYGRLPCPTGRTLALPTTSLLYGLEDCTITVLTSTTIAGGLQSGGLPFRTLNLPMTYALDGFGSRFNYVVTKNLTVAGITSGRFGFVDATHVAATDGIGGIEIRTGVLAEPCNTTTCQVVANPTYNAGTNPVPNGAAYIIFSNGADKRGAVSARGTNLNGCVPTPAASYNTRIDTQNCIAITGTGALAIGVIPPNVFYDNRYNAGLNLTSYFDDYVIWRSKAQL